MSTTDPTLNVRPTDADIAAPRTRFTAAARPGGSRHARPGLRLALSVDRALADLSAPAAVAELTAGLAWAAALGETCLLSAAVTDVRRGIAALRAGDVGAAANALEAARGDLPDLP
ncbi:hypothetical protein ACTG9Q_13605 [Actinokineospora sp. 24-640]